MSLGITGTGLASELANCTGLRFGCVQGRTLGYRNGTLVPIEASERVGEVAVEVDVPILKDFVLARSLTVNGAARYTNYSTSGVAWKWKIGADWEVIDGLRFRATRSRDIRAPSLYDRYQPLAAGTSGYQDIHTGVGGIVNTLTGGNPDLVPEVASVFTAGTVFRPTGFRGFSVAIDYYRMKVSNAISAINGTLPSIQQVCEASNGASTFCALYDRPLPFSNTTAANAPTVVRSVTLNASELKTWGVDAEVNYRFAVGANSRITLRGLVGYQPQLTTILAPGLPPQVGSGAAAIQGTGGVPKWRLTGFITFDSPHWSLDIQERWRSSLKPDVNQSVVYAIADIPSVAYTDLTLTAKIDQDGKKQIFFSVQNLFDKAPPVFVTAATSGTPNFSFPAVSGDDILGRYFTVGARMKF